jgi:hypothetical protein
MFVCCECYVLSGRGLRDELITRPEESYRPWCVVVCDQENNVNEEVTAHWGLSRHTHPHKYIYIYIYIYIYN